MFRNTEYLKVGNKHPKNYPAPPKVWKISSYFPLKKKFTPLHLREAVPDNVIQYEAEQEDRVPVRPPRPAGLAAGAGWPEADGG